MCKDKLRDKGGENRGMSCRISGRQERRPVANFHENENARAQLYREHFICGFHGNGPSLRAEKWERERETVTGARGRVRDEQDRISHLT